MIHIMFLSLLFVALSATVCKMEDTREVQFDDNGTIVSPLPVSRSSKWYNQYTNEGSIQHCKS